MKFSVLSVAGVVLALPLLVAAQDQDMDKNYQDLQEAVTKKDAALVKKFAVATSKQVREEIAAPALDSDAEKAAWPKRLEYLKSVDLYTEYALYATAIQGPAAVTLDLLSTLEQQNPKSKYLEDAYGPYFKALTETGAGAKISAVAEKALANNPENVDLLAVMAEGANSRSQIAQAGAYSQRLIAALGKKPRPEKAGALARAYLLSGLSRMAGQQWMLADQDLRAALPSVRGSEASMSIVLFNLGVANYQLGKMLNSKGKVLEGIKFSEQAAQIKGPYQAQAYSNVNAMKREAERMR